MTDFLTSLQGKRTYIFSFITASLALAAAFGVEVPNWVWALLGSGGAASLRAGMK